MRQILLFLLLILNFCIWSNTSNAAQNNNPIIPKTVAADPEILYSRKTGRFYIYPTSGDNIFKVFSSNDLVHWKDDGVVLALKDIKWERKYPWAPSIIEAKIDGQYKYFFYFCANLKIGVAVGDSPTGPFIDSGKPLIDFKPKGVRYGLEIDPDIFVDPKTDRILLYWGNSYLAVAELEKDFVTIKPDTVRSLKIDGFFEGAHLFYRKGIYYLMWSENDTRSIEYRVRYVMADSPTGPFRVPKNNLVLAKKPDENIYGTGHHSVLNIPGTDSWVIVYHRLIWPLSKDKCLREVCIDRMTFNEDGTIQTVIPTHRGIDPMK